MHYFFENIYPYSFSETYSASVFCPNVKEGMFCDDPEMPGEPAYDSNFNYGTYSILGATEANWYGGDTYAKDNITTPLYSFSGSSGTNPLVTGTNTFSSYGGRTTTTRLAEMLSSQITTTSSPYFWYQATPPSLSSLWLTAASSTTTSALASIMLTLTTTAPAYAWGLFHGDANLVWFLNPAGGTFRITNTSTNSSTSLPWGNRTATYTTSISLGGREVPNVWVIQPTTAEGSIVSLKSFFAQNASGTTNLESADITYMTYSQGAQGANDLTCFDAEQGEVVVYGNCPSASGASQTYASFRSYVVNGFLAGGQLQRKAITKPFYIHATANPSSAILYTKYDGPTGVYFIANGGGLMMTRSRASGADCYSPNYFTGRVEGSFGSSSATFYWSGSSLFYDLSGQPGNFVSFTTSEAQALDYSTFTIPLDVKLPPIMERFPPTLSFGNSNPYSYISSGSSGVGLTSSAGVNSSTYADYMDRIEFVPFVKTSVTTIAGSIAKHFASTQRSHIVGLDIGSVQGSSANFIRRRASAEESRGNNY